jgi:hypothetical protein
MLCERLTHAWRPPATYLTGLLPTEYHPERLPVRVLRAIRQEHCVYI